MEGAVAVVAAVLLAYAVLERRLRPTPISGAMVFTAVGLLASQQGTALISPSGHGHGAAAFLELTLVIALFTDAMAVSGARWATEAPLPVRLLGLGLPLTMVAGWVLALALLPDAGLLGGGAAGGRARPDRLGPRAAGDHRPAGPAADPPRPERRRRPQRRPGAAVRYHLPRLGPGGGRRGRWRPHRRDPAAVAGGLGRHRGRGRGGRRAGAALVDGQGLVRTALAVGGLAGHGRPRLRAGRRHRGQRLHRRLGGRTGRRPGSRGSLAAAQQTPEELANLGISVSFVLFGALFLAPALAEVRWSMVAYAL
jgi:sodium/hydrogen antiporter